MILPEKHFSDDKKAVRLFHDMHTGKWWWGTQVNTFTALSWVKANHLIIDCTGGEVPRSYHYPNYYLIGQDTADLVPK